MLRTMPLAAAALLFGLVLAVDATQKPAPPTNATAATLQEFKRRIGDYVALHKKLESTLPELPKQTDPIRIDKHQRGMTQLIQASRKGAKQGDIFHPAMQRLVRTLLRPIFQGADGAQIRKEILDNEYTAKVTLVVNGRYPDEVPISTVPPQVLQQLPKLEEELEYRFINNHMILFDSHAHLIVDFVERAFQ